VEELVRVIKPFNGVTRSFAAKAAAEAIIRVRLYFNAFIIENIHQHAAAHDTETT